MTEPTYYRTRIVKGGPIVGLKIWHGYPIDPDTGEVLTERPALWRAEVNGEPVPINDVAPQFADGTGDSIRGDECDEDEYLFLASDAKWASKYSPQDPAAKPRERINMNEIGPIKWRK